MFLDASDIRRLARELLELATEYKLEQKTKMTIINGAGPVERVHDTVVEYTIKKK